MLMLGTTIYYHKVLSPSRASAHHHHRATSHCAAIFVLCQRRFYDHLNWTSRNVYIWCLFVEAELDRYSLEDLQRLGKTNSLNIYEFNRISHITFKLAKYCLTINYLNCSSEQQLELKQF
ncbi:hypothetical protein J6590_101248 [Homalodisca vitripennis]|nr:hypothetical protein J6590_101248 [Homalodisca vitripennis]